MSDYIGLDLDGTILNYNAHKSEIRANPALLEMLPQHADIVIISNQGGIPLGRIESPQVARRVYAACQFLEDGGYSVLWSYFSVYHPNATDKQAEYAGKNLRRALEKVFEAGFWSVFTTARSRKPEPYMLKMTQISAYYGDSPEDEQAAKAAGIPFVKVPRFE